METTLSLIDAAAQTGRSLREISTAIGLQANGLAREKNRGRLSPAIAAALALELGLPAGRWALIAAAESEKTTPAMHRRLTAAARTLST